MESDRKPTPPDDELADAEWDHDQFWSTKHILARFAEAQADYAAGRTRSLEDVAAELGIDLDAD